MAAEATVRGGFELSSEAALRDLTSLRDRGREVDTTLASIGRTMDRLTVKRATPTIDLTGFDRVNAQLSEIEARLDRLDRRSVTARAGISGGGGGGIPGGFSNYTGGLGPSGAGRNRAFSTPGGFPGNLPWWSAALPFAGQLAGGAGALLGSAGSAALGAGTVGLGGLATLGAGGALTYAAARPAVQALQQITQAQTKYTQAVAEFGRRSTEAASAQRNLNAAIAANPAAVGASRQIGLVRSEFRNATAPARAQIYRGISGVAYNARRAIPGVGRDSAIASNATANAAISYSGFLAGGQSQATLRELTASFAGNLPTAERSLQNITTIFEHLSVAALPFFHEANTWVQTWTAGMAKSTGDTAKVQNTMSGLVTSAKDWAKLTGAAARDIRDLFAPSVAPGNSMVVDFTNTLDRWDVWLQRNPQKVRAFFDEGVSGTEKIAGIIGNLSRDVFQIFQAVNPLLSRAEDFMRFASGIGGGSALTGAALLYAGYGGARKALGGGGPSAGGLLSSFVLGGPSGAATRGLRGGARVGGGVSVGGGGAGAALGASAYGYRMSSFTRGPGRPPSRLSSAETAAMDERSALLLAGFGGRRTIPIRDSPREIPFRSGAPVSELGAVPMAELSGAAGLIGKAGSAVAGFARAAAPIVGILSAVQGVTAGIGAGGGVGHGLNVGVSTALSGLTLGMVPATSLEHVFHAAFGTTNAGASLGLAGTGNLAREANRVRTPAQLHAVQRAVAGSQLGSELSPADAAKLQAFNTRALATASRNAGAAASNTWQGAFSSALSRGVGPNRAVNTLLGGMDRQITQLGPQGATAFGGDVAKWVAQMERESPKLRRPLQRVMQKITDDLNVKAGSWGDTFQDLQRKVFYFNGQILKGSQTTWKAIGKSLTDPIAVAQEKLNGTFGTIQQEAISALTNMGFTRSQAGAIVHGEVKGGMARKTANIVVGTAQGGFGNFAPVGAAPGGLKKNARGGFMIGGRGMLDTVNMGGGNVAAPGEGVILNRHTMTDISRATRAMYGLTTEQMIQGETRQHAYGLGGAFVPDPGTDFSYGQEPQIAGALGELARQLGVTIYGISGHRTPAHSLAVGGFANDPHTRGIAADIGVNSQTRGSAAQLTAAMLSRVGLYRPFPGAQEINHVQMLGGGARGAANMNFAGAQGIGSVNLRAPGIGMRGVPGALGGAATKAYAAGLSQTINGLLSGGGAGVISGAGFSGGGSSAANQRLGQQMMLSAGWGMDQWPSLQALWMQESGWNANAVNPSSGASGIPQALGHGNVFGLGDAPAQIAWGLNYIRGRYGSPAAAEAHEKSFNWYSRGGGVNWAGWNAKGGNFVTNGPTLFGAGEGGRREHVSISPLGGGGRVIHVNMERVYLGTGDKASLERVANDVAAKIIEALDAPDGASDSELAGAR